MREPAPPVLVVDDNVGFREVIVPVLRDGVPRFAVHAVETATQAIRFLSAAGTPATPRPAFLVVDYHLPDLNAPALLERLAATVDFRRMPVLVLSQADWAEDKEAALAAGATAFAVKPSRVVELRGTVVSFWTSHVGERSRAH
jgi:CheY-like chemotaxis protein